MQPGQKVRFLREQWDGMGRVPLWRKGDITTVAIAHYGTSSFAAYNKDGSVGNHVLSRGAVEIIEEDGEE